MYVSGCVVCVCECVLNVNPGGGCRCSHCYRWPELVAGAGVEQWGVWGSPLVPTCNPPHRLPLPQRCHPSNTPCKWIIMLIYYIITRNIKKSFVNENI